MVGLAGEGQNFDGNGLYVRFQPGGGDQTLSMGQSGGIADKIFANAIAPPLGTRPAYPGKRPPYNSTFPCYKNPLPEPQRRPHGAARRRRRDDARVARARAMRRAIRKHARDFAFVIGARAGGAARGRLHPLQPALLPAQVGPGRGLGLRRLQGPVLHRAVGDAGPGPDGADRGRRRRRHHQGRPRRRARGRDDEDPAQVHADLQERHGAAAPQDRPERHGHRARPGHEHGGRGADGLHRPGRPDAAQRQLRRDPVLAGHATRAATCSCCSAPRARGSTARARRCRPR